MTTFYVRTNRIAEEDGCEPGAFQSILRADEYAQIAIDSDDGEVQYWIVTTSRRDLGLLLDQEKNVLSWSESE